MGKPLTFGSLFAGIGGFDLGFERAGMRCEWQVEIDPYCQRVLRKHWPGVRRHDDVKTFPPTDADDWRVDVICGGFPCQDISDAGKRVGINGERSGLWSEMFRIICEIRPRVAAVENVPALLRRGMGRVLGDLAAGGYDAEWACIPSGMLGSHFRGDRTFIVAQDSSPRSVRRQRGWTDGKPEKSDCWGSDEFTRLVCHESKYGVPTGSLGRVSDGVPHRSHRLRGLGNAVVPQVAEYIGRQIVESEETR